MTGRRNVVEHDADRRVFEALRRGGAAHAGRRDDELVDYIALALPMQWTWRLIGEALGVAPRRAAMIWRAR